MCSFYLCHDSVRCKQKETFLLNIFLPLHVFQKPLQLHG